MEYAKNPSGFDAFVRAELRSLVGYLMRRGASLGEAEDAVQCALTEAYAKWSTIDAPEAWARTVAIRHFYKDRTRDHKRMALEAEAAHGVRPTDQSAESTALQSWAELNLRQLITRLPPQQRNAVLLRLEGFKTAEIADRLSTSENTVRSNLRHARENLRKQGLSSTAGAPAALWSEEG